LTGGVDRGESGRPRCVFGQACGSSLTGTAIFSGLLGGGYTAGRLLPAGWPLAVVPAGCSRLQYNVPLPPRCFLQLARRALASSSPSAPPPSKARATPAGLRAGGPLPLQPGSAPAQRHRMYEALAHQLLPRGSLLPPAHSFLRGGSERRPRPALDSIFDPIGHTLATPCTSRHAGRTARAPLQTAASSSAAASSRPTRSWQRRPAGSAPAPPAASRSRARRSAVAARPTPTRAWRPRATRRRTASPARAPRVSAGHWLHALGVLGGSDLLRVQPKRSLACRACHARSDDVILVVCQCCLEPAIGPNSALRHALLTLDRPPTSCTHHVFSAGACA
jgi:hypothetical protein